MIKRSLCFVMLGCIIGLSGCALKPKYLAQDYAPPQRLALLPMNNQTNDLDGPEMVRKMMFESLPRRGYYSMPLEEIDELLRENGITDGGQLKSMTHEKLGEILHVDGLIYGELLEFGDLNIGFYQRKTVEANFKMVDAATGTALWEDERKVSTKEFALNAEDAKKAFAMGLAKKAVGNILNVYLKAEAAECIRRIVSTMPPGR
ncbi:MAG: GNA1162 family protein [bacterium]